MKAYVEKCFVSLVRQKRFMSIYLSASDKNNVCTTSNSFFSSEVSDRLKTFPVCFLI